jgi:hypothetical protein
MRGTAMTVKQTAAMKRNDNFEVIDFLAKSAAIEIYYAADFFWKVPSLLRKQ